MDKLDYHGKLNAYETNITKELVEILTPFQWATDVVQGQNKITASVIMPVRRQWKNFLSSTASLQNGAKP